MAQSEGYEVETNATTAVSQYFTLRVDSVYVSADTDTYIAFDKSATTNKFLIPKDHMHRFDISCAYISLLSASGNGTVWVLGRRPADVPISVELENYRGGITHV